MSVPCSVLNISRTPRALSLQTPEAKVARWQNLISSFPWIRQGGGHGGAIQGKEGIKFCSVA